MDHHLHIHCIGHAEAGINSRWCGAPILMQFQRAGAREHLFFKRRWQGGIAFARKGQIHR